MHDLYIATTNAPGPGARALMQQALEREGVGTLNGVEEPDPQTRVWVDAALDAADECCEFVELENQDGMHVPVPGVDWAPDPSSIGQVLQDNRPLWRLGPFASTHDRDVAVDALRELRRLMDLTLVAQGVLNPRERHVAAVVDTALTELGESRPTPTEDAWGPMLEAIEHLINDGHITRRGTHHVELLMAIDKLAGPADADGPVYREIVRFVPSLGASPYEAHEALRKADLAMDHNGRTLKDKYGPIGRQATPEEIERATAVEIPALIKDDTPPPLTATPARCDGRGVEGDQCNQVAGHTGPHTWTWPPEAGEWSPSC